jgi:hypothetical protein
MTKGFKSPNIHNVWLKGRYTSISVEPEEAELVDLGEVFSAVLCPDHFAADTTTA